MIYDICICRIIIINVNYWLASWIGWMPCLRLALAVFFSMISAGLRRDRPCEPFRPAHLPKSRLDRRNGSERLKDSPTRTSVCVFMPLFSRQRLPSALTLTVQAASRLHQPRPRLRRKALGTCGTSTSFPFASCRSRRWLRTHAVPRVEDTPTWGLEVFGRFGAETNERSQAVCFGDWWTCFVIAWFVSFGWSGRQFWKFLTLSDGQIIEKPWLQMNGFNGLRKPFLLRDVSIIHARWSWTDLDAYIYI